jgi:hypothetical protein
MSSRLISSHHLTLVSLAARRPACSSTTRSPTSRSRSSGQPLPALSHLALAVLSASPRGLSHLSLPPGHQRVQPRHVDAPRAAHGLVLGHHQPVIIMSSSCHHHHHHIIIIMSSCHHHHFFIVSSCHHAIRCSDTINRKIFVLGGVMARPSIQNRRQRWLHLSYSYLVIPVTSLRPRPSQSEMRRCGAGRA